MQARNLSLLALGGLLALPLGAKADIFHFDFDAPNITPLLPDASNAASATILDNYYQRVQFAYYRAIDPITGELDPYVPVTAANYADYGSAPVSAPNALNAKTSSVWVYINRNLAPLGADDFAVTLDNDTFGDPLPATAWFYDKNDLLLGAASYNEQTPGASVFFAHSGIDHVLLQGGALYDNLTFTAVPEPGGLALLGMVILSVALFRTRRRRR